MRIAAPRPLRKLITLCICLAMVVGGGAFFVGFLRRGITGIGPLGLATGSAMLAFYGGSILWDEIRGSDVTDWGRAIAAAALGMALLATCTALAQMKTGVDTCNAPEISKEDEVWCKFRHEKAPEPPALPAPPAEPRQSYATQPLNLHSVMADKAGELLARYIGAGNACNITLPYMNETALVGLYYKQARPTEWDAGWNRGDQQFKKEFEVSPRMACAAAVLYLQQDAKSVLEYYRGLNSMRKLWDREHGQ